jgi:hypothetical protein
LSYGLPVGQIGKRGDGNSRSSLSRLPQQLWQFRDVSRNPPRLRRVSSLSLAERENLRPSSFNTIICLLLAARSDQGRESELSGDHARKRAFRGSNIYSDLKNGPGLGR